MLRAVALTLTLLLLSGCSVLATYLRPTPDQDLAQLQRQILLLKTLSEASQPAKPPDDVRKKVSALEESIRDILLVMRDLHGRILEVNAKTDLADRRLQRLEERR